MSRLLAALAVADVDDEWTGRTLIESMYGVELWVCHGTNNKKTKLDVGGTSFIVRKRRGRTSFSWPPMKDWKIMLMEHRKVSMMELRRDETRWILQCPNIDTRREGRQEHNAQHVARAEHLRERRCLFLEERK